MNWQSRNPTKALSAWETAAVMGISENSVRFHVKNLFDAVICSALEVSSYVVADDLIDQEIAEWESMGHVSLMLAREKRCSTNISREADNAIDARSPPAILHCSIEWIRQGGAAGRAAPCCRRSRRFIATLSTLDAAASTARLASRAYCRAAPTMCSSVSNCMTKRTASLGSADGVTMVSGLPASMPSLYFVPRARS